MSGRHLFLLSGYPNAVLGNGLGRYICQLQRVTIKFCKSHGASRGVREFIEHDLINFAREHPNVVVYIKPRRHRMPVFVAEFLNGGRKWMTVSNFSREEIHRWLTLFTKQSGQTEVKYVKNWKTDNPSIQGPWCPFLFKNPEFNTAALPQEKFSIPKNLAPSATEILLEMFKNQKLEESGMSNEAVNSEVKSQ